MKLSDEARALLKKGQTERLAKKQAVAEANKGKSANDCDFTEYSDFYASQGLQVAIADHNTKITKARQDVRDAEEAVGMAKVTGENIRDAHAKHAAAVITLAALEQEKSTLFSRSSSFALSGGEA